MLIFSIITVLIIALAVSMSMKRQLMMFQQNSYRPDRYANWRQQAHDSTSLDKLIGYAIFFISLLRIMPPVAYLTLISLFGLINFIRLAKAKYKKPLVFTKRAIRIYAVALILVLALQCVPAFFLQKPCEYGAIDAIAITLTLCYICADLFILLANIILSPVEKAINRKYYNEAANIFKSMHDLKIVGITGSYGKTSTKHYLHRILSEQFDVMMTPGNFNTTLGVVRTVREYLKPYNQVFIVEMGAKQTNDIKEICDLVHPQIGIITAVGPMHLESFKTIENVQATKFELADALPSDGLAVVNNDFEYIANRKVTNVECVRYAVEEGNNADFKAIDIEYTPQGTHFKIADKDGNEVISLFTKLVGSCNVSNLMAAIIVALRLGMSKNKIQYAVEKIEQVEHRLSVKRTASGITIIDDAYNSNPVGSKMALEVLSGMTIGKRIVITPGMIELGKDQYDLNVQLGEAMAKSADIAIVVGEYNRDAIHEGLKNGDMPQESIQLVDSFAQAQKLMLQIAKSGDVVLYENDLPDTFK